VVAYSHGGYTTKPPLADLIGGKAWVATEHEGDPLPREHGGPARLLVPHLLLEERQVGRGAAHHGPRRARLLGANGYHNRGDPWKEERHWTD
jgi:DMSO/TMAO reductase YedYZ molybdopterin-dependent catalytic subunit